MCAGKKLAMALDIDDTLVSFLGPFLDAWNEAKDDLVSLSSMTDYDFSQKRMNAFLHMLEKIGFYRNLPACWGAVSFVNKLKSMGIKIVLITARPSKFRRDTEFNLDESGFTYDDLIFSKEKSQIINNLKNKYHFLAFADDRLSTVVNVGNKCSLPFNFLLTQPHNADFVLTSNIVRVNYILDILSIMVDKVC